MSRSFLVSLFTAIGILLVAMVLLLVMPSSAHTKNTAGTFILVLALAISGSQLVVTAISARPEAATMMAHLFLVFFLIIPGLFQITSGIYAWDMATYKPATITVAALLVLLFVICFVAGGAIGPKSRTKAFQAVTECERRRRGILVMGYIVFAILVSLVAIAYFGIDSMLQNRTEVTAYTEVETGTKAALGIFLDVPRAVSFCAVVSILYLLGRRAGSKGVHRQTATILLALLIFPLFTVINWPPAQPRYWLFGMLITLFLLYADLGRVRNRLMLIIGIGGGAYTIFPFIRALTTVRDISTDAELQSAGRYLTTANFDGFEMVMNIVIVAEKFGHTFGHQLLSAALFFVPRGIWEDKALASGAYTATKLGQAFTNLSAPTMGELYLDFSYFGVVLGGIIIGYLYKKTDTLFAAALAFGGVNLYRILTAMVCGFTIILMRGALLAVIGMIATSLASIGFLIAAPRLRAALMSKPGSRRKELRSSRRRRSSSPERNPAPSGPATGTAE